MNKKKSKVVYFDYWTKGLKNFYFLDAELRAAHVDTMLVHLGSWRFPDQTKEERINDILCRDVSFYGSVFIYNALKAEKPDVVVTLNSTYLMDRAIVLACRALGIRVVFMMHGVRATGEEIDIMVKNISSNYNSFFKKLSKGSKYLTTIIPNYFFSSWKYRGNFRFVPRAIMNVISVFSNPASSFYFPRDSSEVVHDKALVYAKKYTEYYSKLGYRDDQIEVVGNPKNDGLLRQIETAFTKDDLPPDTKKSLDTGNKYAVYLEDALVETGYTGWTDEFRNDHINAIAIGLKKKFGYDLIVKTHPNSNQDSFKALESVASIVSTCDLPTLINFSDLVVGTISTTIQMALLLEKEVLVPTWGAASDLPRPFLEPGAGIEWSNADQVPDVTRVNPQDRKSYIDKTISVTKPIAAENIRNQILSMV